MHEATQMHTVQDVDRYLRREEVEARCRIARTTIGGPSGRGAMSDSMSFFEGADP